MIRSLLISLALVVLTTSVVHAQACGPVFLAGHDADDHGFEVRYASLFDQIMANVANGNQGILAIGADPNAVAATWIELVASLMIFPQTVTFVNDSAISSVDFTPFAMLYVPSDDLDTAGGIDPAESQRLNNRSAGVALFVLNGGALVGLTQGEFVNSWAYFSNGAGPFSQIDCPPSGILPSGDLFNDVNVTADGLALGITDGNLDGCCFHNVFTSFPAYLNILAVANAPNDPNFHQRAVFLGGTRICPFPPMLAVVYDQIAVRRQQDVITIEWTTLSEEETVGFVVFWHECGELSGAAAASELVPAQGPGREYAVVDQRSIDGQRCYYVQEYTVDGVGDRSPSVAIEETPTTGSSSPPRPQRDRR